MIRTTIEDLIDLLNTRGGSAYFGEPVSILEHSLQAAHSAEVAGASPAAISAALLHDIGHMLHGHEKGLLSAVRMACTKKSRPLISLAGLARR